eukprot:gene32360-43228_t
MSTSTISTFDKLNPFKGATAHTWLIFLKDFVQCLNNTGLASIIMEGKDLTGNPYLTLDDMKKNSVEKIFIDFFNTQMADLESTSRALIVSTCYECYPWLFNYNAVPKTLVLPNYVLSGHPDIRVAVPTENAIRQAALDLGFPLSWVTECLDWLTNRQNPATEDDEHLAHNPSTVEQSQMVDRIKSFYMRNKYINAEKLQQMITAEQQLVRDELGEPTCTISFSEATTRIIENNLLHYHEYESYVNKRHAEASKTLERMRSTQESCHKAFSYVGDISTIANAKRLLSENRFQDTFRAINDHFMKMGNSDTSRFEQEARSHILQFGQDLNHHIEFLKASIQRWMLMEQLERERLTPRLNLAAAATSSNAISTPTTCSTTRFLSLLTKDEICDANSYDQEDYRLEAAGIPILLTEHKRYDIYLKSVSRSPSARFRTVADHFSRTPESDQTVVKLIGMLNDTERSSQGIVNLANERMKHPKWHESLHSFLADLQTDTNPAGSNAHLAQAHVAFAGDQSAQLVCLNPRHSKTFSHVSSDCTDPIWGPLWKDHKIDPKTGKPKDGSAIPPQPNRHPRAAPAVVSPPQAPAVSSNSAQAKTRYTGPPCTFCLSKPELRNIASCHSDADCRKKVKYAARQQKWSNKSSSSSSPAQAANVAQV